MDDRHSAMLWQLMQSLSANTHDDHNVQPEQSPFEHTLMSLRPLMSPKQQKIIDLITKIHEVKALMLEIQGQ